MASLEIFDQLRSKIVTISFRCATYILVLSYRFHKITLIIFDQDNALSLSYTPGVAALIYFPEAVLNSANQALLGGRQTYSSVAYSVLLDPFRSHPILLVSRLPMQTTRSRNR